MRQQRKEDRRRGADAGRGDDARDEPAPILDGLANGFDSAVGGVVDGVTGLVQAPIRGVEEGGVVGGIVGVGAGVLGLVVKPVVGRVEIKSSTRLQCVRMRPFRRNAFCCASRTR